jgi:transposase
VQFSEGELMAKERREFGVEEKVAWVKRLLAGEKVPDLAAELGIAHQNLYKWLRQYRVGGAGGLSTSGHSIGLRLSKEPPSPVVDDLSQARKRIAELERKVGQQNLDLDFFRAALRRVEDMRQARPGVKPPTKSSKR